MPLNLKALLEGVELEVVEEARLVPEAKDGVVRPTPSFRIVPEAMRYFEFYTGSVGEGHLKPVDGPLLEKLCYAQMLMDRVVEEYVASGGDLVELTGKGTKMISPHFHMFAKLMDMIRMYSAELGLTPPERSRLRLDGNSELKKPPGPNRPGDEARQISQSQPDLAEHYMR